MPAGVAKEYVCPFCPKVYRSDKIRRHITTKHAPALVQELPANWERITPTFVAKKHDVIAEGVGAIQKTKFCVAVCLTCGTVDESERRNKETYLPHVCHEKVERPGRRKVEEAAAAPETPAVPEPPAVDLWADVRAAIMNVKPWKGCDKEKYQTAKVAMQESLNQAVDFATEDDGTVDYRELILTVVKDLAQALFVEQQARPLIVKKGGFEI